MKLKIFFRTSEAFFEWQKSNIAIVQNKFSFHPHFENHRFRSLSILQIEYETYSTTR